MTGIEPAEPVWKTGALPLSYIRVRTDDPFPGCSGAVRAGVMVPQERVPTPTGGARRTSSGPVHEQQRPVVVLGAEPLHQAVDPPLLRGGVQHLFGLADEAVDPQLDLAFGGLD